MQLSRCLNEEAVVVMVCVYVRKLSCSCGGLCLCEEAKL